jgi:16S rRNA (cytosine1402-N4)-methyltransferase
VLHHLHQPVMPDQVVRFLRPRPGGTYVDLTLGLGGHARIILDHSSPDGRLLGVDRDPEAVSLARKNLASYGDRFQSVQGDFSDLLTHLHAIGWSRVDGMLADLGVSSLQLDKPARGFSFQQEGPLDMRMNPGEDRSLGEQLDMLDVDTLAGALKRFGEVVKARSIARKILKAHKEGALSTTLQLAKVASEKGRRGRIHPATRVFMALRMLVNREIEELTALLEKLPEPLSPGGRMVFLSFHSLEDRLVKERFKVLEGQCVCPRGMPECRCGVQTVMRRLVRRPAKPTSEEIEKNPRARSARLRAAERLAA